MIDITRSTWLRSHRPHEQGLKMPTAHRGRGVQRGLSRSSAIDFLSLPPNVSLCKEPCFISSSALVQACDLSGFQSGEDRPYQGKTQTRANTKSQ